MRRTRRRRTTSVLPAPLLAGLLAVALAATACGQESDRADDPQTTPTASSEPSPSEPSPTEPSPTEPSPTEPEPQSPTTVPVTGDAGVDSATLVSATKGGGRVETLATALDTEQARTDFAGGLEPSLAEDVLDAVEALEPPPGELPYAVVAAIGCDAPVGARIDAGEAGYEVAPTLPKETVQCLAPVTFVLVFTG